MRLSVEEMKRMGFREKQSRSIKELRESKGADRKAAACDGKARHPTKDGAIWAAHHTEAADVGAEPYLCTFCHGWHIGTPGYK